MAEPKRILVVEDEAGISKMMTTKLALAGFKADAAFDGEEALDILARDKYDLVLLDLLMPKVDGFGVLAELQRRKERTPVIVATNLNQPSDVSRVFELGCTNYYVKADTSLDQIIEHVQSALGSGPKISL
jgi:DNA-binding response OmpR family regulator